jgi:UDP-N-acetylmuramoyl-tripeptide--D-alanyl-D-alanine ligase
VLATQMRVVSTHGNRNNELGVPLTVLQAGSDTDALVVEMGMRSIGQIARLAEIAQPDVGLITNVGTSHIEILGSQDLIARAKGELIAAVPPQGAALLNGDDAYSELHAANARASVTLYGLGEKCDVRAVDIELDEMSRASFQLISPQGDVRVKLGIPGRHNVYNALAAAAVGLRLAVPLDKIAEGLAGAVMTEMRMETFSSASGVTVINDAYNANPTSMRAAIETLASMAALGRRIAVLGDMAELGSLTELAHFELGVFLAEQPIDLLVTVGPKAKRFADGALAENRSAETIMSCDDASEAATLLEELLEAGDVVLVKASRVMGLEQVVERIVNPSAV